MIEIDWQDLKQLLDSGAVKFKFIEKTDSYFIYGFDGGFSTRTIIKKTGSDGLDFENNYKLNSTQKLDESSPIQKAKPVIIHKPEEDSLAMATHDFTDKTTWYSKSVRVLDEVLSSSDNLTFTSANPFWIDVVNGKVNRQDTVQEYAVIVKVNEVVVTDGFTINHRLGTITFDSITALQVKVSYSYATTSDWVMVPDQGKTLIIEHSEIQFSLDVKITTPMRFEIWVYNPYDLPNKVLHKEIQYNSIRDLVNEANLGTGTIPSIDDLPQCVVFPFNYASIKPFQSSTGAELRVRAVDDLELEGSYGTATFYLISRNDS